MRKLVVLLTISVFSLSQIICAQNNQTKKKAIFIILDGISSDAIEEIDTPNLDEISQRGGYTRAYVGGDAGTHTQTPTVSAVGYNSLITGTWVHKHNVWGNSIKDPNYNYWNVFRIVENFDASKETAIFSTWLDNRTKLVGEGLSTAGSIKLDYAFDGFEYDTINFPHAEDRKYISQIDEHVSKETQRYISKEGPDLSWVYLEFTDDMGHKFGDSPQFHEAIELADRQVGRIWSAIKEREIKYNEDWMIAITTDHGRSKSDGKGHGGQSERERATWIVTNKSELNKNFKNTPGVVDIMPSILKHMEIPIPTHLVKEIDGTSFVGDIAVSKLKLDKQGDKIKLSWKSHGKNQKGTILLSTSNNFKTGGTDSYQIMTKVKTKDEAAVINVADIKSKFYKIILKTNLNTINKWIVINE